MTSISKTVVAIFLATFGLSACGEDGSRPSFNFGGDGGTNAAPPPEASKFTGTWVATSGNQILDCDAASFSAPVVDDVTWTEGADADLDQREAYPCAIHADVRGSTAQGRTATCALVFEDGATGTFTLSRYAFVLDPSGLTANEAVSAVVTETIRGSTITCTLDKVASYRKLGR